MSDLIKDIYGKTTIRFASENSAGQTLVTVYEPASKFSVGLYVPTAELLAALNAVPAEKLAEAESELAKLRVVDSDGQDLFDRAVSRADRLEAERDALAKTVERVRELREEARRTEARSGLGYISQVTEWFHKLDAALGPEPAFVLPTEAGVKFYAEDSDGDSGVFTTLAGGKEPLYIYDDDQDAVYSGPELASWQNFRLLDGEA